MKIRVDPRFIRGWVFHFPVANIKRPNDFLKLFVTYVHFWACVHNLVPGGVCACHLRRGSMAGTIFRMAAKSKPYDPAAKLKAVIEDLRMPLSAVAFNARIDRKRLKRFLDGSSPLLSSELGALLTLLDLKFADAESEQRHLRNASVNGVTFDAIAKNLESHGMAYAAKGSNATGTFVTLGDRELVATASHTLCSVGPTYWMVGR